MAKRTRPTASQTVPETPKEKKVELEINADAFTCQDYEDLTNWTGGVGNISITQAFDILDRVIVCGFRQRRFVDVKSIISTMLEQLSEVANGQAKN